MSLGCVGIFWVSRRERGRGVVGRKNLLLLQRAQGKKKMHSVVETIPF
jgi:hypothetical protein